MIGGLQRVGIEAAHDRVAERDNAHELHYPNEILPRKPLPGRKEDRCHLPYAKEVQIANERFRTRQLSPVAMIRIGEGGEGLARTSSASRSAKILRCFHPIAYELEKALASDFRLLAKQVVAKKLGKPLRGYCGDERAPRR